MAGRTYRQLSLDEPWGSGDGATTALVLGIASLVGILVIFEFAFALVTAPLGLLVGIATLVRGHTQKRGRAISGVVCSALAIVVIAAGVVALNAIGDGLSMGDDAVSIGVLNECDVAVRARFVDIAPGETLGLGEAFDQAWPYVERGDGVLASVVYWNDRPAGTRVLVVESSDARLVERRYDAAEIERSGPLTVRGSCVGPLVCTEGVEGSVECTDE